MPVQLSPGVRKLFEGRNFAFLATVMPDGSPQVTPMWVDMEGDYILMNTAEGRQKPRNIRRDPRVAVAIFDSEIPYRYAAVRGRVVEMTAAGADAVIDRLAKKYLGQDRYPFRRPTEVRLTLKIDPERVASQGVD